MIESTKTENIETIYGLFHAWKGDLITNQLKEFSAHTRNELAMLKSLIKDGDTIIDLGAHIGTFSIPFARFINGNGKIYSFEGSVDNFDLLKLNIKQNSLEHVITPTNGIISDNANLFSMIKPSDENTGMFCFLPTSDKSDSEPLDTEVIRIDQWYENSAHDLNIDLLKIDIEGAEMSALRSCEKIINRYLPIIYIEINKEALDRFNSSAYEIEALLKSYGYHFFRNTGPRNSNNDDFKIERLNSILEGGVFFDLLAVHPSSERYPVTNSNIAITVKNLSKIYYLYNTPQDRLRESLHPLRKKYHHDFYALSDVSFEVKRGTTVGVIGRNGSGKSTLLKIITGVLTPSSGSVTVNGRLSALLELGAGFNPELTGIENIYFNGMLLGISREEMKQRLDEILAFADIGEFVYQPVKSYSSGMFVRLAFAVAVCVDPDILIVDEALSVGDMAFQQKCLDRLEKLREKGVTILLVTHDIMLTRNYCEYVVYLQKGKVVMLADAETAGEAYIRDMKSEGQRIHPVKEIAGGVKSRVRFGNCDGELTEVEVVNPDTGLPLVPCNDPLRITLNALIKKSVLHPRFHVQIRDFRGYPVYGVHAMPDEIHRIDAGDCLDLRATFTVPASLMPGDYGVTAAINNAPAEHTQTILDKQVGVATFTVIQKPGMRVFNGVANLNGKWDKVDTEESGSML